MLFHWRLHRNQSAENKAAYRGRLRGSMEKDIPNVICVPHKHCTGECQPAVHSGVLHADDQILHSCDDSDPSVAGVEEILRVAHLGVSGPNCGRDSSDLRDRAELQHVWLLCCHGRLPGHIHKDHLGRVAASWIQIRQHQHGVLHGSLCDDDPVHPSTGAGGQWRGELAEHVRVGGAGAGDHRHVGCAGLLPQLLHLLRDPLDDGRDLQRGRQPQGGGGGAGVVDDLPEPHLGHERRRLRHHARRLHLLRLRPAPHLAAARRGARPAHAKRTSRDAAAHRREARRQDLAAADT